MVVPLAHASDGSLEGSGPGASRALVEAGQSFLGVPACSGLKSMTRHTSAGGRPRGFRFTRNGIGHRTGTQAR